MFLQIRLRSLFKVATTTTVYFTSALPRHTRSSYANAVVQQECKQHVSGHVGGGLVQALPHAGGVTAASGALLLLWLACDRAPIAMALYS
jgi:hypothetical protein